MSAITSVGSRTVESSFNFSRIGATVTDWRERGKNVLFPKTQLAVDGKLKTRGGMHPCFPNFGKVDEQYGLPQHGSLRDTKGLINHGTRPGVDSCRFDDSRDLLGDFNEPCCVFVSMERLDHGFVYRLSTQLSSAATKSVPISAGLHPYFATPAGVATVIADDEHEINGLLTKALVVPLKPVVYINIPEVGMVQMVMEGLFASYKSARLVIWRDRTDYLCVEPVLAMPDYFDTTLCPRLQPGQD